MSNATGNKNQPAKDSQGDQTIQNPFNPVQLVKGLSETLVALPKNGVQFRATCDQLATAMEKLYQDVLKFPELEHVWIYPEFDRGEKINYMHTIFCFNTTVENSSITKNGDPNGSGIKTILDYAPSKCASGEFSVSKKFTEYMSAVAILDNNGNIPIRAVPNNRNIAAVEVDFMQVMALCLNIDEDQPYNFTVLTVDPGSRGENGYDNAIVTILKYIDNGRRYRRTKSGHKGVDYRAIDRAFARQSGGGQRNY